MRLPQKPAALRFFLAFFDRCAIKTSLHLPPAALRFSARHANALPRCPSYSYNQNRTTHLCKKNPLQVNKSTKRDLVAAQPLLRFPKKSAALRFSLAFFDRCAIKTSLYLPQAALRFSARHANALPRCPNYSYNPKQNHPLMQKNPLQVNKSTKRDLVAC